jgi:hypothetical protein
VASRKCAFKSTGLNNHGLFAGDECRLSVPAQRSVRSLRLACLVALAVMFVGCDTGGSTTKPPSNDSIIRGVLPAYATASRNLNRPPENLDELKVVLASVSDDPSSFFRSQRDNEDFLVAWGLNLRSAPPGTILACERTGVDGIRKAVTTDGHLRDISAEEFAKLKFTTN